MTEGMLLDTMRQGLWLSVSISAPILGVALVTGLCVGLFQALTSVQEMTLTFVPKLAAMLATFWASMSFMSGALSDFFRGTIIPQIAGG
ncbi:MAG: flagellar biosynthetic protein FliQ [Rhodobacteraceae bacterium]|nr:flagellar biosynthetic protein FliQ [Paracoccaceae bacterium]